MGRPLQGIRAFLIYMMSTVQKKRKMKERALSGQTRTLVFARSSLALVADTLLHNVLVGIALRAGLVTTLCRSAPNGDGVNVTL